MMWKKSQIWQRTVSMASWLWDLLAVLERKKKLFESLEASNVQYYDESL